MSYTLTQKEYSNLKRRLTTVRNRAAKETAKERKINALKEVVDECRYATRIFESKGYPDAWSTWERAREDAELAIRRLEAGLPV